MRPEEITAQALKNLNDDKYLLSIVVAKRAGEIMQGDLPKVANIAKNAKPTDIALLEISQGLVEIDEMVKK
jgi:DNA-directed RNA polymerase subunit omega